MSLRSCSPRPIRGSLTFIAPTRPSFDAPDPQSLWEPLALDGLEVIVVPGNHDSILRDPEVVALAKALTNHLAPAA